MNLRKQLLEVHSKPNALKVVDYIGTDKKRFAELMKLFFDPEYRISQRAAFAVGHCFKQHPELLAPYLESMLDNLERENLHDAIKRNTVRILQFVNIPEELMGKAADICFKYLSSVSESIAIKVFSMSTLYNISKTYPELQNELKVLIEDQMPYGSAGFRNRGAKILTKMQ